MSFGVDAVGCATHPQKRRGNYAAVQQSASRPLVVSEEAARKLREGTERWLFPGPEGHIGEADEDCPRLALIRANPCHFTSS